MLIASSPVEIEAKADEAGLTPEARGAAIRLFHVLTDRIGQAVVDLDVSYEDWPNHRFYFAADPAGLDRLLAALRARADILDVTDGWDAQSGTIGGLFACAADDGFDGVLVAHRDHAAYASS